MRILVLNEKVICLSEWIYKLLFLIEMLKTRLMFLDKHQAGKLNDVLIFSPTCSVPVVNVIFKVTYDAIAT